MRGSMWILPVVFLVLGGCFLEFKPNCSDLEVVVDSAEVKAYKLKLPETWAKSDYRIVLRSSSSPTSERATAEIGLDTFYDNTRVWEQAEEKVIWSRLRVPLALEGPEDPLRRASDEKVFCSILVLVRNPLVQLVDVGFKQLYDDDVNVILEIRLADSPDTRLRDFSRKGFKVEGRGFHEFLNAGSVCREPRLSWIDNELCLGTICTYDDRTLYRHTLVLVAVPKEETRP